MGGVRGTRRDGNSGSCESGGSGESGGSCGSGESCGSGGRG